MPRHSQKSSPPHLMRWSMLSCSVRMPVEALRRRRFGMARTNGKNERKKNRRRNADRRKALLPRLRARPRLDRQAPIYRRSTAALVPRSLSSQGTQHQAFASWDLAARVSLSVGRALPAPTCPSPARPSRPGRSANAARERVAKPRAGAALAPQFGIASRTASDWARFGSVCIQNSDECQPHSDEKFRRPEARAA